MTSGRHEPHLSGLYYFALFQTMLNSLRLSFWALQPMFSNVSTTTSTILDSVKVLTRTSTTSRQLLPSRSLRLIRGSSLRSKISLQNFLKSSSVRSSSVSLICDVTVFLGGISAAQSGQRDTAAHCGTTTGVGVAYLSKSRGVCRGGSTLMFAVFTYTVVKWDIRWLWQT